MASHSGVLAWRIPWTEEPGGVQSTRSQRVGQDWVTNTATHQYDYPACMCAKLLQLCLTLVTPWTVACQAPLSMRFSRQDYWSVLHGPPPGDLSDPGIETTSLMSPTLAGGFLLLAPFEKLNDYPRIHLFSKLIILYTSLLAWSFIPFHQLK